MSKKKSQKPGKIYNKTRTYGPPHPWRLCPLGQHWVSEHRRRVPPSKSHPAGYITTVHATCRDNPSEKDSLYTAELQRIAETFFESASSRNKNDLGYSNENKYNSLIEGWTKYWNEVLSPKELLDSDLVKALIASESGFNPGVKPPKGA